jgi:hypothetical protein
MRMRRLTVLIAAAAALTAAPAAHAATRANWNTAEQKAAASAGILPRLADNRFHGDRPLSGPQLTAALGGSATVSSATISVTGFDARLVAHLGLTDVAQHVQDVARRAGLNPPATLGTEVVARFMGLRTNHPAQDDAIELYPWEPITRAEAAHSFAVLGQSDWAAEQARAQLSAFELPRYDATTKRALRVAVS